MIEPVARAYQESLERLDRWFEASAARHPGIIPCRATCSACCYGPFDISAADTLLLRRGLTQLPPDTREEIRVAGREVLSQILAQAPGWAEPYDLAALGEERFDGIAEALADVPCPMLDGEGLCRVYEHRPLVCRLMGLPMMTAEGEILENACPIQEQFPEYTLLDPQLFDLGALQDAEVGHNERSAGVLFGSGERAGYETTIAVVAAGN